MKGHNRGCSRAVYAIERRFPSHRCFPFATEIRVHLPRKSERIYLRFERGSWLGSLATEGKREVATFTSHTHTQSPISSPVPEPSNLWLPVKFRRATRLRRATIFPNYEFDRGIHAKLIINSIKKRDGKELETKKIKWIRYTSDFSGLIQEFKVSHKKIGTTSCSSFARFENYLIDESFFFELDLFLNRDPETYENLYIRD